MSIKKIAVIGLGYVGLANTIALSQNSKVIAYDIASDKILRLKNGESPIAEQAVDNALTKALSNIIFTNDFTNVLAADLIIIATPTDYDSEKDHFNTESIEQTIDKLGNLSNKTVLIKSTIPVGYTDSICHKYQTKNIIFSPEFLREGHSLHDVLHPSRIIIGEKSKRGQEIANLFKTISQNNPKVMLMNSTEAEAVKLFANTYLANRVAFFNELDTYTVIKKLNTKDIIEGVCADERIGNYYNNPSFGYGGYCLPKDTKQLVSNYADVPNDLITAIVKSNKTRKDFIVSQIVKKKPKIVGIYRLIMKAGSDNFRTSSIFDIIDGLKKAGIHIIIYEPSIEDYDDLEVDNDLADFKSRADLIVTNRLSSEIADVKSKIYTRDLYGKN